MEPAFVVTLLWLVFGGLHIGLASGPTRTRLVAHLGEWGFAGLFSLAAAVSFTLLVTYYAAHRAEGAGGLALGEVGPLRWVLMASIVAGVILVTAGLLAYPRMPMARFGPRTWTPRGIERVTRHPFFAGMALVAVPHALLATHLVGTIFAAGFALLAIAGARHQDAKLLTLRGRPYGDYLAATSALPFAAILSGQQRLAWGELPAGALLGGLALALWLRTVHGAIFAHGGAWVIGVTIGGAAIFTLQEWRRARRLGSAVAAQP